MALMPDDTTAPVTAEDLRERAAQAIRDANGTPEALAWWRQHPVLAPAHIYAEAVLAALAGDPGDLPARMADALVAADAEWTVSRKAEWKDFLAAAAMSVRWEYAARQAAEVERMRARAEKAESELAEARMALDDVAGWETSQRLNVEAQVERLRAALAEAHRAKQAAHDVANERRSAAREAMRHAEQAECGLTELIELKGRLAAADEAFKDMAQTSGGLHPADALTRVARIMATLRGAETPHRVAYEQVRKEAWAEVERLEDRLRKAEGAYSMLDAQRLDAEATRDRWKARAEEAEAERDAARLIVEELQALRDSMYGQLDSAVAERDALQAAIAQLQATFEQLWDGHRQICPLAALDAPETPGDAETEDQP